jgi:hypothetical protein
VKAEIGRGAEVVEVEEDIEKAPKAGARGGGLGAGVAGAEIEVDDEA